MVKRHVVLALIAGIVLVTHPTATVQAQSGTYTLIDLHAPTANGINNRAQVTGSGVADSKGYTHGYRITPPSPGGPWFLDNNHDGVNDLIVLLALGKGFAGNGGVAINTSGVIGGSMGKYAAVWSADLANMTFLTKASGQSTSALNSINDNGDACGVFNGVSIVGKAVLDGRVWTLTNGSYTSHSIAPVAPYNGTVAYGINNAQQAVGAFYTNGQPMRSFVLDPATGKATVLFDVPGQTAGAAFAINNSGQIVGHYWITDERAYLWLPSAAGSLPPGLNELQDDLIWRRTVALAMNNPPAGQTPEVIGWGVTWYGAIHAFAWDEVYGMRDLNDVVTNLPAGWYLKESHGINDLGQICGVAVDAIGATHGFVLAPNL